MLECDESNDIYGTKYLDNAYWNDTLKGWVLSKIYVKHFMDKGASIDTTKMLDCMKDMMYSYNEDYILVNVPNDSEFNSINEFKKNNSDFVGKWSFDYDGFIFDKSAVPYLESLGCKIKM